MSKKEQHCPSCGYTEEDAKFHMDHSRCKNAGNAPWEKRRQNAAESLPAQPEQKVVYDAWGKAGRLVAKTPVPASKEVEPAPQDETEKDKLTDIYEVYGKSARSQGWDFMVCKTLKEALGVIESDLDELDADPDKEDELRIVFRRYTESQMEDVIYE